MLDPLDILEAVGPDLEAARANIEAVRTRCNRCSTRSLEKGWPKLANWLPSSTASPPMCAGPKKR